VQFETEKLIRNRVRKLIARVGLQRAAVELGIGEEATLRLGADAAARRDSLMRAATALGVLGPLGAPGAPAMIATSPTYGEGSGR
jgi:hypothetical protein